MDHWPVFSEKELVIGNLSANLSVCTLWSPREKFTEKYLTEVIDKIAVIGNLYSVFGVGILIRNCLANPDLRYLIVSGTELGIAKKFIENITPDDAEILFLQKENVIRFLEQVKIFFVDKKDISKIISEKSFREDEHERKEFYRVVIALPEPKTEIFPAPASGHTIRVDSIKDGWFSLLKEIRLFGHLTKPDSEGWRRQELWEVNMVITSQDPLNFSSIPHPEYDTGKIQKYCEDFWNGTEPEDVAYRYGHIIRFGFGDQAEAVVEAFKKKEETFRTVISLWDPDAKFGSIVAEDPPCLTSIHPRLVGNYLHLWAYIRTNDMFSGWPLNAAALRYFQRKLVERLKEGLNRPELYSGDLGVTSGSAHLYERDWVRVDAMIDEKRSGDFSPDPKGNFEIKAEDEIIVVNHYSPGGELLQTFRGNSAEKLSKQIAPFVSEIRNALYVGRELQRTEQEIASSPPFDAFT